MALNASDYGYVLENGRIVMEDTCERCARRKTSREFYLGLKDDACAASGAGKKKTWR
jgi:branched-chain amino acid transport system ATP-binding protein